ncbi:sulfotransferase 1C4-like [Babylonia areolata]|uniref:sulfotransferase 1C4-like n=1 Tax=Babylonia areolata TaxID=304850 RepID=UPI003FD0E5A8
MAWFSSRWHHFIFQHRKLNSDLWVLKNTLLPNSRTQFCNCLQSQNIHGQLAGNRLSLTRMPSSIFSNRRSTPNVANSYKGKFQHVQYSTRQDARRTKNLMIATYVSAAVGAVLLTAVGFRFYGRFRKRARGIEEIEVPHCGRRNRVICRYRGYSLPSVLTDTIVNDIPFFEVRPDDVWVVSFPKAGTTWTQEIVYLICNDCDFEKAKATNIEQRFPYLEFPVPGHREITKMDSPRFIKTHVPFSLLPKQLEEKSPKVIYIARNPKDTVVSLLSFLQMTNYFTFTGTTHDFAELFVEGKVLYGPWTKHVMEAWEQRNRDNVLFITYEDLHKDFRGTVREVARFLGKTLSEPQLRNLEQHCSFQNMSDNDSVNYSWMKGIWKEGRFLRKGEIGDWKRHLSPEMSAKLDTMVTSLEPAGLQFVDS